MAVLARILADTDGVRLTDTDGSYLTITGDTVEAEAPDAPEGLAFDKATGALSWDDQFDAAEFRVFGNDKSGGPTGRRTRAVGTVLYPTRTINDGALADGENRSYEVRAFDDYTGLEGPPSSPIYPSASDRKLRP